jgi:dynamin 1-like protein
MILRNVREYVPKTVGFYFINPFKKELRFFLLKETNNILSDPEAMEEDKEVAKKRNYFINLMKILKNSEKALLQDEE